LWSHNPSCCKRETSVCGCGTQATGALLQHFTNTL